MGTSPVLKSLATGLRTPGWLALAAGVALLGLHHIAKTKLVKANPLPHLTPHAPTATGSKAQRDIRDDIPYIHRTPHVRETTTTPTRQAATRWSPAVFAAIEWRRFEAVCEKLFGQAGFETKSQSHGANGDGVAVAQKRGQAQRYYIKGLCTRGFFVSRLAP